MPSLHGGSLKTTQTVPLTANNKIKNMLEYFLILGPSCDRCEYGYYGNPEKAGGKVNPSSKKSFNNTNK